MAGSDFSEKGNILLKIFLYCNLCIIDFLLKAFSWRKPHVTDAKSLNILLTGNFYSHNWINSHLIPLSLSERCNKLTIISIFPVQSTEKIEVIMPGKFLTRYCGSAGARLITFIIYAIRNRPDAIGGFHLLFNGMAAIVIGRILGLYSIYFSVGGPAELMNGGVTSENKVFSQILTPSKRLEGKLISIACKTDVLITMGTTARHFFIDHGFAGIAEVISGGIPEELFYPAIKSKQYDVLSVGRIEQIKRFDIFINMVNCLREKLPGIRAVIVGDGSLLNEMKELSDSRGLEDVLLFAGKQENTAEWYRDSKVFVLASDSEGLSLSLMEAMLCGLPAVVSDVGDLGDLVEDGINGHLVDSRDPEIFANAVYDLISNEHRFEVFSSNAHLAAQKHTTLGCVSKWGNLLAQLGI